MIAVLQILLGAAAIALSIYMLVVGKARDGVARPFLSNGVVNAVYVMAILALFFGGGASLIAAVAGLF